MGPTRGASCDWYTAISRVMPPSTSASHRMSASLRPACGNDPRTLSILMERAGLVAVVGFVTGKPVRGETAVGWGGLGDMASPRCPVGAAVYVVGPQAVSAQATGAVASKGASSAHPRGGTTPTVPSAGRLVEQRTPGAGDVPVLESDPNRLAVSWSDAA